MTDKERKNACLIAHAVVNKMGKKKGAELLGVSVQNLCYIENMSSTFSARNEIVFLASKGSCRNVLDWYSRTGGVLD